MARKRDPRRDEAFEIWKQHNGEITNRALAEQLGVPEKTISAWKSRDKWNVVLQNNERSTTNKKKSTAPNKEQQNRSGNPNPKNQFTKRNQIARKHGLRAKYFSETQREIMEDFDDFSIADQLWLQIEIKFSAIIQLQKIMWVEDPSDTLSEESMVSSGEGGSTTGYKIVYAYEQYEAYIKAQARAMAEYRNLIKQFNDLTHEHDERRLKLEQMQLGIEKTKVDIDKAKADINKLGNNEKEPIIIEVDYGDGDE